MTQRLLALISLLAVSSAPAKDGGLVQTGSVSVSQQTNPATGLSVISRSTKTNLFDEHGNLAQSITLSYFNGVGIPDLAVTNNLFYDRRGNLFSSVQEIDFNGDGVPDELITNRLFYDRHGSLLYTILDSDAGADGTVDERSATIYTNFSSNPRQVLILVDDHADGTIDQIITRTYTYDSEDRLTSVVSLFDTNADGVADFHSVSSWTYYLQDHLLFFTNEDDFYSPGTLEVRSTETSTLNGDAKPISSSLTSYDPNIGAQITRFLTYTYDKFGNLVQQTQQAALPGPNGPSNETTVQTFFYAHRGPRSRGTQQGGSETEGTRRRMED
jgi:hypothetical protein